MTAIFHSSGTFLMSSRWAGTLNFTSLLELKTTQISIFVSSVFILWWLWLILTWSAQVNVIAPKWSHKYTLRIRSKPNIAALPVYISIKGLPNTTLEKKIHRSDAKMDIQFSALPSMTTSFQAVGGIAKWRLTMKTWFVTGQSWHQTMKLQNLLCQGPPLRAEPQTRPSFLETKIGQNQKNKHSYWSHEYAKASPDRKYNDAIFSKLQVLFQLYHWNPKCQKICSRHTIPETMQHLKLKPKILEEWTYTNCGRMHGQMHQNNVVWLIGAVERFI